MPGPGVLRSQAEFDAIFQNSLDGSAVVLRGVADPRRDTDAVTKGWFNNNAPNSLSVINVKNYGAVGDGVHDDAPAINSAILAAQDIAISSPPYSYTYINVYLPGGIYLCKEPLVIPGYPNNYVANSTGIRLRGDSMMATQLMFALDASTDGITLPSSNAQLQDLSIKTAPSGVVRDLVVLGNKNAALSGWPSLQVLVRCNIIATSAAGWCVHALGVVDLYIEDSQIISSGSVGGLKIENAANGGTNQSGVIVNSNLTGYDIAYNQNGIAADITSGGYEFDIRGCNIGGSLKVRGALFNITGNAFFSQNYDIIVGDTVTSQAVVTGCTFEIPRNGKTAGQGCINFGMVNSGTIGGNSYLATTNVPLISLGAATSGVSVIEPSLASAKVTFNSGAPLATFPGFIQLSDSGYRNVKTMYDVTDDSGTPGPATINKPSGIVSIAAGQSSVQVTNSLVTASSIVVAVLQGNDGTLTSIKSVVPSAGSFIITGNAVATGNVKVAFIVSN